MRSGPCVGEKLESVRTRLEQMLAELKAINAWDRDYVSQDAPDEIARAAWKARRARLEEIRRKRDGRIRHESGDQAVSRQGARR